MSRVVREFLTVREAIRLPAAALSLRRCPRGDGRPVLLVPGLGATNSSLLPLRLYLRQLGHDAQAVHLGRINDDVAEQYERIRLQAEQITDRAGQPVVLIGWSIGGVLAREAARDSPANVARVITFGTPAVGGPAFSIVARRYDDATLRSIRDQVDERNQIPLTVPITAIWSRNDGVVDPAACFDRLSPDVEHIEVRSTHLGMGVDPTVWRIIAKRLAPNSSKR